MANEFLSLSLFIMLLSFFIILNSISDVDPKKAQPILNSVMESFNVEDDTLVKIADIPSVRSSTNKGTTLDQIAGFFEAHIEGMEMRQNRLGTELRIRLPLDDFEKELMTSMVRDERRELYGVPTNSSGGFFLNTLVSLLDTAQGQTPYKMDMILYFDKEASIRSQQAAKVTTFIEIIEGAGIPQKMISAGVDQGPIEKVDLYFRPYFPIELDKLQEASSSQGDA